MLRLEKQSSTCTLLALHIRNHGHIIGSHFDSRSHPVKGLGSRITSTCPPLARVTRMHAEAHITKCTTCDKFVTLLEIGKCIFKLKNSREGIATSTWFPSANSSADNVELNSSLILMATCIPDEQTERPRTLPGLLPVVNYFENSYLGQATPEGPRTSPKFPVQFWNHHSTFGGPWIPSNKWPCGRFSLWV